jgi:ABC-type lipoprotein export system ATPase subunit
MSSAASPILRADALARRRDAGGELLGVSLSVETGRFTLLSGGPCSGAGLLLRVLGLLERPDAGEVWFDGRATGGLDDGERMDLRNHAFGFLFAEPFLLDSFTVAENVAMPLFKISGLDIEQARARTAQVLDFAGLAGAADYAVRDLSVLDHHKVALARAVANTPQVLIAEDAGLQLTGANFREFAALLRAAPEQLGVTVIATSQAGADALAPDRELRMEEGRIAEDTHPAPVEEAPTIE